MLRNHGSRPRLASRPGRLAATLAAAALLVSLVFPAQLLAAPGPAGPGVGSSFSLQIALDMLWGWLGLPPAPPVAGEEDGPEPMFLPDGCHGDPLGNCSETNGTSPTPEWSPPETETSPEE